MRKYFVHVYGAPFSKTDGVAEILQKENNVPFEAVYIGDALSDYKAASRSSIHFIARISGDPALFDGVQCTRLPDLKDLEKAIIEL